MVEPRLVLVEWQDSHCSAGWQQLDGSIADRALVCRSVGWLIHDGAEAKVVAPHLSENDSDVPLQGNGIMTIPARAVLRVTELLETPATSSCSGPASAPMPRAS